MPVVGVKDLGGGVLSLVAGIPAVGVKDLGGAVLGLTAGIPADGVMALGAALGREGTSTTADIPPAGVRDREDGGGGRVEGTPLAGESDRCIVPTGACASLTTTGAAWAGVSLVEGGMLGRVTAGGRLLDCAASMPPAGVNDRGGGVDGLDSRVATAVE
jgi:hypothetical protein